MSILKNSSEETPVRRNVRALSPDDFMQLGMDRVVYIKPVEVEGVKAYAIQAADGTTLGVEDSFDHAIGAVQNTEMNTVLLQ